MFLALDIGRSKIAISHGDEVLEDPRIFPSEDYWSEEGVAELIEIFIGSESLDFEQIEGVGVCVPGVIDRQRKVVEYDDRTSEIDFSKVEEIVNLELNLANDADAAVLGQYDGEYENVVNIVLGSGIGAGVIRNGQVLFGRSEPGFSFVGDEVWEYYCGGDEIPSRVNEWLDEGEMETLLGDSIETAEEIFDVEPRDEVVKRFRSRFRKYNAKGIANVVNSYGPGLIAFTGSVATENPDFIKKSFERAKEDFVNEVPDIKISGDEGNVQLKGALALAKKEC